MQRERGSEGQGAPNGEDISQSSDRLAGFVDRTVRKRREQALTRKYIREGKDPLEVASLVREALGKESLAREIELLTYIVKYLDSVPSKRAEMIDPFSPAGAAKIRAAGQTLNLRSRGEVLFQDWRREKLRSQYRQGIAVNPTLPTRRNYPKGH